MTNVVAIWCRHEGDNVIGVGKNIPWNVPSDTRFFLDVVNVQNVVCGRKTYESLPDRTIKGSKIFVLTRNKDYEVSDTKNHKVVGSQKELLNNIDEEDDIYVAGGGEVYELFMTGKEKLKPFIIVDCIYKLPMDDIDGDKVNINSTIDVMNKNYKKISADYERDNVVVSIWVKKGEFVEQRILKRILLLLNR